MRRARLSLARLLASGALLCSRSHVGRGRGRCRPPPDLRQAPSESAQPATPRAVAAATDAADRRDARRRGRVYRRPEAASRRGRRDLTSGRPRRRDAPVTITAADLASRSASPSGRRDRPHRGAARPQRSARRIAAFYAKAAPLWVGGQGAGRAAAKAVIARLEGRRRGRRSTRPTTAIPDVASPSRRAREDWAEADSSSAPPPSLYARDARGAPHRPAAALEPRDADARPAGRRRVLAGLAAAARRRRGARRLQSAPCRAIGAEGAGSPSCARNRPTPPHGAGSGAARRCGSACATRACRWCAPASVSARAGDETVYDERVAAAVAAFQKQKALPANGILTPQTVAALGGPSPARLEGDLVANMERWRWLPRRSRRPTTSSSTCRSSACGSSRGRHVVHQARVIVGKPETPTPIFSDEMEHVIVNPSWTCRPRS